MRNETILNPIDFLLANNTISAPNTIRSPCRFDIFHFQFIIVFCFNPVQKFSILFKSNTPIFKVTKEHAYMHDSLLLDKRVGVKNMLPVLEVDGSKIFLPGPAAILLLQNGGKLTDKGNSCQFCFTFCQLLPEMSKSLGKSTNIL